MANAQQPSKAAALSRLGPGLITGAADDDPSGIATYSQAGAQFGLNILWTLVLTYPLMVSIQTISARIGRVTGYGLATNIRRLFPAWLTYSIVFLLLVANTINIAADIAAMGDVLHLIAGGRRHVYAVLVGLICLTLQVFIPYARYVRVLKWLTLSLFTYVAVVFTVHVPWGEVLWRTFVPHVAITPELITIVVAVFGTTISPYLMFWQASQEIEELRAEPEGVALVRAPLAHARVQLNRITLDTSLGMAFSNLVAFSIVLSTAVTLHSAGITHIETSAQAAEVLRPLAGELTFLLFSLGIVGTGMLAVPVLAGSAAYALSECFGCEHGLDKKWSEAKAFYAIIAVATLIGVLLDFSPIDPIRALLWTAIINGIVAIPVMAAVMVVATRAEIMGSLVIGKPARVLGWIATAVMLIVVVAMFVF